MTDNGGEPLVVVVGVSYITVTFGDGTTRELAVKNRYALFTDRLTYSVGDLSSGVWTMVSSYDLENTESLQRLDMLLETAGTTLEEIRTRGNVSSWE